MRLHSSVPKEYKSIALERYEGNRFSDEGIAYGLPQDNEVFFLTYVSDSWDEDEGGDMICLARDVAMYQVKFEATRAPINSGSSTERDLAIYVAESDVVEFVKSIPSPMHNHDHSGLDQYGADYIASYCNNSSEVRDWDDIILIPVVIDVLGYEDPGDLAGKTIHSRVVDARYDDGEVCGKVRLWSEEIEEEGCVLIRAVPSNF